ncbi:MAG: hypothetical protein ABFD46_08025 [Armatimonadota bacterium]
MKKLWLCLPLLVLSYFTIGTMSFAADDGKNTSRSLYFREPPQELAGLATTQLADLEKGSALSDEEANSTRKLVGELDLTKPATLKALKDGLHRSGSAAIAIIQELMESQDDETRKKAVFALRCTLDSSKNLPKENTVADSLSATLLHRSIYDRKPDVRRSAMVGLRNLAISRSGKVRSAALGALQEGLNDPDVDLRQFAEECCRAAEPASSDSDAQ